MNMLKWLNLSLLVIVLDQITKWWASSELNYATPNAILPMFNLTLIHNHGAAFSFLSNEAGWQRWFFVGLALFVSLALTVWLKRVKSDAKFEAVAIALIIGGALGNVIDRLIHGYVVDFLDFYVGNYHWPAFNVADSAICLGAILLIIDSLRTKAKA